MSLYEIIKLMEQKYPGNVALLIYDDESGRITDCPTFPYEEDPLFSFLGVDELIKHLQETE